METSIPDEWRVRVASILRSGDKAKILTRLQSDLDWQSLFPDSWDYQRFDAMAKALEMQNVVGRLIETMAEQGETYAFWFQYEGHTDLYAKINLTPSKQVVIIYSSHKARKGDKL
jgi:hypothetical protein